jgi:PAS domain S-box-containing protein
MTVETPLSQAGGEAAATAELDELRSQVVDLEVSRDRNERELAYLQQEIRDLEESIVVILDSHRRVIRWNPSAVRTFDRSPGHVLGRQVDELGLVADPPALRGALDTASATGEAVRLDELSFRRPDGSDGLIGMTINPLRRRGEPLGGFFLLGKDITERVEQQTAALEEARGEGCARLACRIADELDETSRAVRAVLENAGAGAEVAGRLDRITRTVRAISDAARDGRAFPDPEPLLASPGDTAAAGDQQDED